jgi:hypothetical protein
MSRRRRPRARRREPSGLTVREISALRREVEGRLRRASPRWNADPEDVRRSVAKLVLTLVEFLRKLFERQAIRRLEARTLTARETEALGVALMRLEKTIRELARHFDLDPDELNLDLGPLGRLH